MEGLGYAQGRNLIIEWLRDQLARTGVLTQIGAENIFLATETIGEAGNAALQAATNWLAETAPGLHEIEDEKVDGKPGQ